MGLKVHSYYCVVSSNKTGRMATKVIRIQDIKIPDNRYKNGTWYDYFMDRERALEFASLLRG